jgi:3-oxoacyl-[acyl-carrier protein] reductase
MTSLRLAGQVAVVTGAAKGLGRAIVERLTEEGAHVMSADIDGAALEAACAQMPGPGRAVACVGDVTDRSFIQTLIARCEQEDGPLSILVNNAGMLQRSRLEAISEQDWDQMMAVNVKAMFLCIREAVASMRLSRYGRIVNIASDAGKSVSTLGGCHYTASKAAVLGLTRHLGRELAGDGILVNAVCPGLVDTPMSRTSTRADEWDSICRGLPQGRANSAHEIASVVAFLCSPLCTACVGSAVDANGGSFFG